MEIGGRLRISLKIRVNTLALSGFLAMFRPAFAEESRFRRFLQWRDRFGLKAWKLCLQGLTQFLKGKRRRQVGEAMKKQNYNFL